MLRPSPLEDGVGNSIVCFEATSGFAYAATRRFAQLPFGAFVKKLSASGYPLHPLQATWVNYQTPTLDFNQQVIRFTRHTLRTLMYCDLKLLRISKGNMLSGRMWRTPTNKHWHYFDWGIVTDKTLLSHWQAAIEKFMSNSIFFDVGL